MNKNGPVIIIEDDEDDQYLLEQVFIKLNYQNKVVFFLGWSGRTRVFTNY
jgi:hypothetical protein